MQIIWSERAFIRREAIEDYILYSFGFEAHAKYVAEINHWKATVLANPEIGIKEPILEGLSKDYRSFTIANQTKCIYYIENDFIVFVDWWDTRRAITNLKMGLH
ncbi:MAG: type II toxin-antitoxin system RelE/ParE family toxin [Bacteroidales bacterium]|nr:type II toxin-antitoxin system RelE/ParE family toxin [Candidatus Colicola equi]